MFALAAIAFSLVLLVIVIGVIAVVATASTAILAVVGGILAIALALPGAKDWIAKELPRLEQVQCHQLPTTANKIQDHRITRNLIQRKLQEKAPYLSLLEVNSNGRLEDMFNSGSPFNNFSVEQITDVAANGAKYPVLFLDLGVPASVTEISSPGPVVVYKSGSAGASSSLRTIRSATAVIFCNENFASSGWTVDTPMIVVADQDSLQNSAQVVNSHTADGTVKLVKFELLRKAAKDAIARMLNGQPMFPNMTDENPTDAQAAELRSSMLNELKITTITPPAPVVASTPNPDVPVQADDVTVSGSAPEIINDGQSPWPAGTKLFDLVWERSVCKKGFIYARCDLKLERRDIQFMVDMAFAKKGGVIRKQKQFLKAVDMEFAVSNPRVFFRDGRVGIKVDIEATNLSAVGAARPNNLGAALKPGEQSNRMSDKLMDVVRVAGAAKNAAANAKRSLVLSVPKHILVRDATVAVGQVYYDKSTNLFYLADAHLLDFDLTVGQRNANIESFKPFIRNSVDEFLKPHFAEHPIFDFSKIKYGWLGRAAFQSATIGNSDIRINVKAGWQIF